MTRATQQLVILTSRSETAHPDRRRPRCGVLTRLPLSGRPAVWDSPRMSHVVVNAARPETREQRAWYWYDWANSAYVTTTATVLMAPYLTSVAEAGRLSRPARRRRTARRTSAVLGIPVAPGSLCVLHRDLHDDPLGDRPHRRRRHRRPQPPRPTRLLAGFAWVGAAGGEPRCSSSRAPTGSSASLLVVVASICLGASLVIYDSILCRIANAGRARPRLLEGLGLRLPRRRHPARAQLRARPLPRATSGSTGRCRRGSAAVRRPLVGRLHDHPRTSGCATSTGTVATPVEQLGRGRRRQLRAAASTRSATCASYPQTMLFLLAYLFFNDGIQTVIGSSSVYGIEGARLLRDDGARRLPVRPVRGVRRRALFGRVAARIGAWRTVLVRPRPLDGRRRRRLLRAREVARALPRARPAHRPRPRRHPGPVPLALQPAHPPRPRGGVLQPLPGHGARHELVRHADLRARLPVHRSATAGRSSRSSSSSSSAACCSPGSGCARASSRPATRSPPSSETALTIPDAQGTTEPSRSFKRL